MDYETETGVKCGAEGEKTLVPVAVTPVHAMTASRWAPRWAARAPCQAGGTGTIPRSTSTARCVGGSPLLAVCRLVSADAWEPSPGSRSGPQDSHGTAVQQKGHASPAVPRAGGIAVCRTCSHLQMPKQWHFLWRFRSRLDNVLSNLALDTTWQYSNNRLPGWLVSWEGPSAPAWVLQKKCQGSFQTLSHTHTHAWSLYTSYNTCWEEPFFAKLLERTWSHSALAWCVDTSAVTCAAAPLWLSLDHILTAYHCIILSYACRRCCTH